MIKIKLVLFFLLFGLFESFCQDFSKSSLFGGVGVGSSKNSRVNHGLGFNWSIGYQGDIWKNRLRIVPGVSFGAYSPTSSTSVGAHYNSTSLKVNLNFDILKIKTFSLLIGSGLAVNISSGLIVYEALASRRRSSSERFNESHFIFSGLIGLRLNPARHRIGYELLLFDGSSKLGGEFEKKFFSELTFLRARVIMKLK